MSTEVYFSRLFRLGARIDGDTSLLFLCEAVQTGDTEMIKVLVEHGAQVGLSCDGPTRVGSELVLPRPNLDFC